MFVLGSSLCKSSHRSKLIKSLFKRKLVSADRHFSLFIGHIQKGHYLSNKISLAGKKKKAQKCGNADWWGEEGGQVLRRLSVSSLLGCLRFVVFTVFFFTLSVSTTRSPGNVAIVKKNR